MGTCSYSDYLKYRNWRYQLMEKTGEELKSEISNLTRSDIIDWLQWNDPNGIYTDELSLQEFGEVMTREEGIQLIIKQITGEQTTN